LENERNWKENKGINIPVCSDAEDVEHILPRRTETGKMRREFLNKKWPV